MIYPIHNIPSIKTTSKPILNRPKSAPKNEPANSNVNQYYNTISFCGKTPNLIKAEKYLSSKIKQLENSSNLCVESFDLDKLEGIQDGIKLYKGLNLYQIDILNSKLLEIPISRGCHNQCKLCIVSSKLPIKETPNAINRMKLEDFNLFIEGNKELYKRITKNMSAKQKPANIFEFFNNNSLKAALYDSDLSNTYLLDKNNNELDYIYIAKKLNEIGFDKLCCDTAGWDIKDKATQKRMEQLVSSLNNEEKTKSINSFAISFNPFGKAHWQSFEAIMAGDKTKSSKKLLEYIDQTANVFFTFTPIIDNPKFEIMHRFLKNGDSGKYPNMFGKRYSRNLFNTVMERLKELYIKDFEGEQKHIKSKEQIKENIYKYRKHLTKSNQAKNCEVIPGGKALSLFNYDDKPMKIDRYFNKECSDPKYFMRNTFNRVILDINGSVWLSDSRHIYPAFNLNFYNKNKKTAAMKPHAYNQIINKEIIENYVKKENKKALKK